MRKTILKIVSALLTVLFIIPAARSGVFAGDPAITVREGDNTDAPGDNEVVVGIEGTFVPIDEAAKETILSRINEIRKEACTEGVPYPGNRSKNLTEADYVPIKWSQAIEQIAAMRAVESSIYLGHGRLADGSKGKWNYNGYGVSTNAENIAWNFSRPAVSAILAGIDQWYDEKSDWVNNTSGAVTGHYTSMINPNMKYIGLAGFYNENARYRMTVCNQMSVSGTHNASTAGIGGTVMQKTLVKLDYVTALSAECESEVGVGETVEAQAIATVQETTGLGTSSGVGPVFTGLTWESSDSSVATVGSDGVVTGRSAGKATVTASLANGKTCSFEITVKASFTPGDINGDGAVNNKDVVTLFNYVNGIEGSYNVPALDPNGDGKVNNKDVVILFRFVSGADDVISDKPYNP